MGIPGVDTATKYLLPAGIRAERGFPGRLMPQLTGPVVAVNVHKSEKYRCTLVAAVCSPMNMGAYACEDLASKVAGTWRMHGATCHYENNRFDGQSGIYIIYVYGTWETTPPETAAME